MCSKEGRFIQFFRQSQIAVQTQGEHCFEGACGISTCSAPTTASLPAHYTAREVSRTIGTLKAVVWFVPLCATSLWWCACPCLPPYSCSR